MQFNRKILIAALVGASLAGTGSAFAKGPPPFECNVAEEAPQQCSGEFLVEEMQGGGLVLVGGLKYAIQQAQMSEKDHQAFDCKYFSAVSKTNAEKYDDAKMVLYDISTKAAILYDARKPKIDADGMTAIQKAAGAAIACITKLQQ